jgi:hypothetical protein
MVYNAQDHCFFGVCPSFGIQKARKNKTFLKLDLFLKGCSFMLFRISDDGPSPKPGNPEGSREQVMRAESGEMEEMSNNRKEWSPVVNEGSVLTGLWSKGVKMDTDAG